MAAIPALSTALAADPSKGYATKKILTSPPRAVVVVYGIRCIPKSYTITRSIHGAADTATFVVPVKGNPDFSAAMKDPSSNDGAVVAEIYFGFPASTSTDPNTLEPLLQQRFLGIVDNAEPDANDNEYTFECSSLSTLLMAEKQATTVRNQTTTQYLQAVAANAGLQVSIKLHGGGAASKTTLQEVFADDFVTGIRNERPWDILKACAEVDDVDLWEHLGTIYYWAPEDEKRTHVVLHAGQDFTQLKGSHSPQFAKNIEVEVVTFSPKTRISHSTTYTTDGATATKSTKTITVPQFGSAGSTSVSTNASGTTIKSTSSSGGVFKTGALTIPRDTSKERIVLHRPNLTLQQADDLALAEWKKRSRYEYKVTFKLPITPELLPNLTIETVFEIYGWNATAYNTTSQFPAYFQRRFVESFSIGGSGNSEGATVEIEAVNHQNSVESTL